MSYSNEHHKINWKENLTKYAFWLGPAGPTDKKIKFKMYKTYCFRYKKNLFGMVRIRIRIKQPDPDPYQIEKPDSDQKDLVPQH
jgi:hypothetical protein